MSIQILGIRTYIDKYGATKKAEKFFDEKWRAPSVQHLLNNVDEYVQKIPEAMRFNLFFTLADCLEKSGRSMNTQEIIMFDIDGIDKERKMEYIEPVCHILGLPLKKIAVLFTGNGLHFYIMLEKSFTDTDYFTEHRPYYKTLCSMINKELDSIFLTGEADPAVFSTGRMGRLPLTENRKPDKDTEVVSILVNNLEPIVFDMTKLIAPVDIADSEQISDEVLSKMPPADKEGILANCIFLKWCKHNQEDVSEPQWYAMLSILGRLEGGRDLAHEYSNESSTYNEEDTDNKLNQALLSSGPRKCTSIEGLGDWCVSCKYKGKQSSPITLQREEFIKTETEGFWNYTLDKTGNRKISQPNYDDLQKAFNRDYCYVTIDESRLIYVYDKNYYKLYPLSRIESYIQEKMNPKPKQAMRSEFTSLIKCTNLQPDEWTNVEGMINFSNGVLDLKTKKLLPHSRKFGFRYCLDYDYEPDALCPMFDIFMNEITLNDQELINVLLEFFGYSFSNIDPAWGEKALVLVGEGSNGKSVLLSTMSALAGRENYAVNTLTDLQQENNRFSLMGKLFNVAEETPKRGLLDSALFKNLTTGGETTVKLMYHQPFKIKNYCKLIFACNELPDTNDMTMGLFRRLLIIPFDAIFLGDKIDRGIRTRLLTEKSGIFNRVIEGYDRLIKNSNFSHSVRAAEKLSYFINETDLIKAWFNESMREDTTPNAESNMMSLFDDFSIYCIERGQKVPTFTTFVKRTRVIVRPLALSRATVNGRKVTTLLGYKLGVIEDF